jgi:hypothetical protein
MFEGGGGRGREGAVERRNEGRKGKKEKRKERDRS